MTNVFYQDNILIIGGVETFLYELAKLCSINKRDLTIVYRTGDKEQIKRLQRYCNVVSLQSIEKPIKCKKAFFNYNISAIDDFDAEEYIQLIHADFQSPYLKDYPIVQSDKITQYIAVSMNNAKSFESITGIKPDVYYNPITIDDEPRIMTLVSAQRLSPEKGGDRMCEIIRKLDMCKIPYVWHIFSTDRLSIESDNVVYHKPTLDIRRWIKYADYMVLVSDTEGFSYGAYESLCIGTPLIITRLPILDELGSDDTNSIILDFDLSNLDVHYIYKKAGNFKFHYNKKSDKWMSILGGIYNYVPPKFVTIKALADYFDVQNNTKIKLGDTYEVSEQRALEIINAGYATLFKEDEIS